MPARWASTVRDQDRTRRSPRAVLLTGRCPRSCLFAAYHLLERCGVRFFGYRGRDGEIVPHAASLGIGAGRFRRKAADDVSLSEQQRFQPCRYGEAPQRSRLGREEPAQRRHAHAFPPRAIVEQVAMDEIKKRGMLIAGPGHVLARLTPERNLFVAHPEYFPLIEGKRRTTYSAPGAVRRRLLVQFPGDAHRRGQCGRVCRGQSLD